jgi:signal transduction histidine kinase/phage shock protein PspC (stress-responsive transcriptional regulator)
MSAGSHPGTRLGLLRRDRSRGWLAGVCAGIARRYGIDPALVRLAFVGATAAGGFGIALYALAWLVIPAGDAPGRRRLPTGRGAVEVALGTCLLLVSALLAFRELGILLPDPVVWPLLLIATGGALIWRGSATAAPAPAQAPTAPLVRKEQRGTQLAGAAAAVSRTGVGIALVIAAGFAFLQATGALSAARNVVLAVLAVVVVLGVIFAPWVLRLVRSLTEERAQRIRSQERAEMAAHLHDSVLQTLALVQRRSSDPQEVAALARRQERELRAWLAERPGPGEAARLEPALEAAAAAVEESHGVPVEVVVVGERELDPAVEALVAAAREAMTNAAKFGAGSPVDVYAESNADGLHVFIRDRGPGFDPAVLPADRRGVRESIVGRMRRHGGRATITSSPGTGTEVELELPARSDR